MDAHSTTSEHSLSSMPLECPCCNKEVASRSMFLHIKAKHPGFFQQQTTKNWLQEAQLGKPLKIFWNKRNDFNEEETFILFGCLSSGKTFNYEPKAIAHFKKNPSDLKEHNRLVSEFLKIRNTELEKLRKEKEEKAVVPERAAYIEMKKNNDPELCKALMDVINNHMDVCERLAKDAKEYLDMTSKVINSQAAGSQKTHTVREMLEMLDKIRSWIDKKPTDFKTLSIILAHLWHFLHLRKFFNGHMAPELSYPWFHSRDHPEGELSYGSSRFAKYIWPWETPMNPIDNTTSWIEV
jgi:hypothetical protein